MTRWKWVLFSVATALVIAIAVQVRHRSAQPAAQHATATTEASWDDPAAQEQRALALVKQAKPLESEALYTQAQAAAERALMIDPHRVVAHKVLLLSLQYQHQFGQVAQAAESLAKQHPHDAFFPGMEGDGRMELGDYAGAEHAYQRMMDLAPGAPAYARVGYLRYLEGDGRGAISAYQLALESTSRGDAEAMAWGLCDIGDVYLSLGEAAHAAEYYQMGLRYDPHDARAHVSLGQSWASRGDWAKAAELTGKGVSERGKPVYRALYAQALDGAGRAAEAKTEYARTLREGARDRRLIAQTLLDSSGDPAKALSLANAEFQARQDVITEGIRAQALLQLGRLDEAATAIAHATRLKTRSARLWYVAGAIAEAQGKQEACARDFALALEIGTPLMKAEAEHARTFVASHPVTSPLTSQAASGAESR